MIDPKKHFLYTEGGGIVPEIRIPKFKIEKVQFIVIDLFCGAGGTGTGFEASEIALVIAAVNHDPLALESHWKNYPDIVHFEEDIRTLNLAPLVLLLQRYRELYPDAKIILWSSLECTNFSKAKGGQPRDADSRTLADHLPRYIEALQPDYIQIENVVEFMSWGPLRISCKKLHKTGSKVGRKLVKHPYSELKTLFNKKTNQTEYAWIPESKKNGQDFMRWCNRIDKMGYYNKWKELNSADFGAYTSRNRLFGCFARPELPIAWPESTHAKVPIDNGLFGNVKKWKAVKDVLDLEDEGSSIFNRKKPLVDASLERIEAGLIKFVAGGKENFILKYNSMAKNGDRKQSVMSVDNPAPTIPCQNRTGMCFIAKYYSGKPEGKVIGVDGPAGTITRIDGQSLINCVPFILNTNFKNGPSSIEEPAKTLLASRHHPYVLNPCFLTQYYSNGGEIASVEEPGRTLGTKDTIAKIQCSSFITQQFSGGGQLASIQNPLGSILSVPKANIVKCDPFILNPSHGGHTTGTDVPCVVIIARQDKAPLYLIQFSQHEGVSVPIYDGDSEVMIRIKKFMALYGISDIKMRMLKVSELLPIQGFPKDYYLAGNQTDQKKFIGNSVVPQVVTAWCLAMGKKLKTLEMLN